MIKQIKSQKIQLPTIFLVETKEDYEQLPKGIPYIIGTEKDLPFIRLYLEFQVIFRSCKRTNLPIDWTKSLKRLGYNIDKLRKYDLNSGGDYWDSSKGCTTISMDEFVQDQYLVNFDKLAELKVLPKWLDDITQSIHTNIIDEVMFDPTAFNKQLGLNVGAGAVKHNPKNLLILDVSGSIPRAVVKTTVALSKLMSKKFYADIIVTSGQSVLIDYEEVQDADIEEIARISGSGNEGEMFSKIIQKHNNYNTVIAFGDNDNPEYYLSQYSIPCNMKVETVYSLHTKPKSGVTVGYARAFKPKNPVIHVQDWIETIN